MTLQDLQDALRAVDARAVLVPRGTLDQIVRELHPAAGIFSHPPHRHCQIVERQVLLRHIEQSFLPLPAGVTLPETVILMAEPPPDQLSDIESKNVLLEYWRTLFHASVHLALSNESSDLPRLLIEEIRPAGFEELRSVLIQDDHLPEKASDWATVVEFAAVYLETRFFAPDLLSGMFPGIRDPERIDAILEPEIKPVELFVKTRPPDAPDPPPPADGLAEEPESMAAYWSLVRASQRASRSGDSVRAAMLRMKAWRIAPASLGDATRRQAVAEMELLHQRLAKTLSFASAEGERWSKIIPLLIDKADQGVRPVEAKLLQALQDLCREAEQEPCTLDLIEWLRSGGRRPIKRHLPSLKMLRIARKLRACAGLLASVRISDADRQFLADSLKRALIEAEEAIRNRVRPMLRAALHDAGLDPVGAPEKTALLKLVEEWADRLVRQGFLSFSDLRDGLSANQLKMPDLRDGWQFARGDDPLLRLDSHLPSILDGVYRRGNFLRLLERLTAAFFSHPGGRSFTLWFLLPVSVAIAAGIFVHEVFSNLLPRLSAFIRRHPQPVDPGTHIRDAMKQPGYLSLVLLTGVFVMSLIHSRAFRRRCRAALHSAGIGLHRIFIDRPRDLLRRARLYRLVKNWVALILWRCALQPAIAVAVIWWILPGHDRSAKTAWLLFLAALLATNSQLGQAALQWIWRALRSVAASLRAGLLPALFRQMTRLSKQAMDAIDGVLFRIEDLLRSRSGESRWSTAGRAILGALWMPFAALARFYTAVMIEPCFNPNKLPASILAAKIIYPLWGTQISHWFTYYLTPVAGTFLAGKLSAINLWFLPDAVGFLYWEIKENWNLYRSNRRQTITWIGFGPRGESPKALMEYRFHAASVPRLYKRLRHLEREGWRSRNSAGARACREELDDIRRSICRLSERELLGILNESPGALNRKLSIGDVVLTTNRILLHLRHEEYPGGSLEIEWEFRDGYLTAAVRQKGWLEQISPEAVRQFIASLVHFYKLAGVDIVREEMPVAVVEKPSNGSPPAADAIVPAPPQFAYRPLRWEEWVAFWQSPPNGHDLPAAVPTMRALGYGSLPTDRVANELQAKPDMPARALAQPEPA